MELLQCSITGGCSGRQLLGRRDDQRYDRSEHQGGVRICGLLPPQGRSGTLRSGSGTLDDRALHCRAAPAAGIRPDGEGAVSDFWSLTFSYQKSIGKFMIYSFT